MNCPTCKKSITEESPLCSNPCHLVAFRDGYREGFAEGIKQAVFNLLPEGITSA